MVEQVEQISRERPATQLRSLRELVDIVLRRAIYTASAGGALSAALRGSLHRVCVLAQRRGLLVEELLVLMKESWYELPEAERLLREQNRDVLSRVIALSIEEYYDNHPGANSARR
jgi:hypothetical protein